MKGILINYEYCTGCHSCEVACKKHLGLTKGEFGIKLEEVGPYGYEGKGGSDRREWSCLPVFTKADRDQPPWTTCFPGLVSCGFPSEVHTAMGWRFGGDEKGGLPKTHMFVSNLPICL